jgi:1-acyl-sn-glycerol-3-phosphate acyltransferase
LILRLGLLGLCCFVCLRALGTMPNNPPPGPILAALACAWVLLMTLLAAAVIGVVCVFDRPGRVWWRIARLWGQGTLRVVGVKQVHLRGLDRLVDLDRAILMANHDSYLDPPLVIGHGPEPIRFVAKSSLFWIPVFGLAIHLMGMIPVNRSNRKKSIASLAKAAAQIRSGKIVLVFPEGTRSVGESLGRFKKGGFMLALDSGAPIIPIGIAGTGTVIPPGWNRIRPGPVAMVVGSPIPTEGMDVSDRPALMAMVEAAILEQRGIAEGLLGLEGPEE